MKKRRRKRRPKPASVIQKEENIGRKKYSCYICFDKFATSHELDIHKQSHQDDEDESSRESPESVASECFLDTASDSLNDEDSSQDDVKDERSQKEQSLKSSEKEAESKSLECRAERRGETHEENKLLESSNSDAVQNTISSETDYKCLSCNVYFQNQVDIKSHIHTQYSCKYYCRRCSRQFTTKGGFIVHVLQHGMKQTLKFSYKCNKCHFTFDDCYQLKRHYVTVHNLFTENTPDAVAKGHDIIDESADQNIHRVIVGAQLSTKAAASLENKSISTMDPTNPITGAIPIFDCDVCYDVFASEKALIRHKSLHTLEGNTLSSDAPICIEDDDLQVVHQESDKTAQEVSSHVETSENSSREYQPCIERSMPKLVPALSNDNKLNVNKSMPDLTADSNDLSIVSNPIDKLELSDQIKKMLAGKTMPPLAPMAKKKMPSKLGLATDPPVSKPEISVPTDTANINIVNSGFLQHQSPALMSGGQSYFMINPNSLPIGSMNRQHLSGSVVPQTVLSEGVATIPSTSTSSAPFLLNTNINTPNQPPILNPLGGLPSLDPGQTYFVLVPANQLNQNEGNAPTVKRQKKIAKKPKPATSANASNVISQNREPNKKPGLLQRCLKGELSANNKIRSRSSGQSFSNSVMTPFITNYQNTIDIRDPLELGESHNDCNSQTSKEMNSDFVMPIITSISTVADESVNKNEKVRKDPASKYESEFAKFLREKNDSKSYIKTPIVHRYTINTVDKSHEKQNLGGVITIENDDDQDSSKAITDLTSCIVDDKSSDTNSSSGTSLQSSSQVSSTPLSDQKPKIFVKKLTDLIDISRTSPEPPITGRPHAYTVSEYCGLCNESFCHWGSFKAHMQAVHGKLVCKFYRCLVLNTSESLEAHMKKTHNCSRCGGEFRSLARHYKHCGKTVVAPEIVVLNADT